MFRLLTLVLLLSFSFSLRVVSDVTYSKVVNSDSGLELLLKTTIPLEGFDIKLGASETFTAPRSSAFSFNHNGFRIDIGALWTIADFEVGYTHSHRQFFEGAYPKTVYMMDSVDSFTIRKEFNL